MSDHASQRIAELRDKLDKIEVGLAGIRGDVARLERSKRTPPRAVMDRIADLCLRVTVGALEVRRDVVKSDRFEATSKEQKKRTEPHRGRAP